MQNLSGWDRLKIVWSITCVVIGIPLMLLAAFDASPEIALRIYTGTAIAISAFAFIPYWEANLITKLTALWIGGIGGLGLADKGNDSALMALITGVIFWLLITAACWIIKGFMRPKR